MPCDGAIPWTDLVVNDVHTVISKQLGCSCQDFLLKSLNVDLD
jgi:hypothetical protein